MEGPPFEVVLELPDWRLFWSELEWSPGASLESRDILRLVTRRVREKYTRDSLSADPVISELRRLFRLAGCDPTRYRPASEALLRRVLKGDEMPAIHPLVDLNNCLSLELAVPCCVMAEGTFHPPLVFRRGRADEEYESLKGPFRLEGKPLLVDSVGPLDAPITGSKRVMIQGDTTRAWMVAYVPSTVLSCEIAAGALRSIADEIPSIRIGRIAAA